jgi:hypothetical protein
MSTAVASMGDVLAALRKFRDKHGYSVELHERYDGLYCWTCDGDQAGEFGDLSEILDQIACWDERLTEEQRLAPTLPSFPISGASTTNSRGRRGRRPDPKVTARREQFAELAEKFQPATVRQVYYLAESRDIVPKDETKGYRSVQRDLVLLRQSGRVEYEWISDNTRWMRKSRSYQGIDHFLKLTTQTYRRDLWASSPVYVEIWCEKDAIAGVIMEETDPYDVPLMVAKGCSSITYLYEAAQAIKARGKPAYVYASLDHDPTGKVSARHIERMLREYAPGAEIHFELVAVTPEQIAGSLGTPLSTRPTKREKNRHAKDFVGDSCELEAIPPDQLRMLVRDCIERHIDRNRLAVLQEAEKSERQALEMFAQKWRAA